METIRTPVERFENLKDYPFREHYQEIPAGDGSSLRMHYLDEGEGEVILCMHGQPSWSYLYRKMIPIFVDAGYRVIAPDLVGFGKSDKLLHREDYTVANHIAWMKSFIESLDLKQMTIIGQDWGGLIGFRLVAENLDRFARVVAANTGLPDAREIPQEMAPRLKEMLAETPALPFDEVFAKLSAPMEDRPQFMYWVRHADAYPDFHPAAVMKGSLLHCDEEEYRAWAAPFPSDEFFAGARQFPTLVPISPDNPAVEGNRAAWDVLEGFDKPWITAYGDSDPVTKGAEKRFIESVPGAKGQAHTIIKGAGHFIQDDAGEELAAVVIQFIEANPI
ncbi:MAG: haloalkane dehalogenase [Pseudomonadales bacterium]|nr:haloalkane dehalogenase [Pseudomonadales bacterium]MBO6565020.1 haloalkane dehalogenase [Pseudomonadales bacterium]MBO6597245.1 haloalkane dehalogenase [Pseudomonadales bacterium]MBO6655249.1 haloalkane dehalogenase [Pseudomonadales bacterium]MBO6703874.1 haloalkane dehalogenase [Pseudomonadales bacterium]